MPIAQWIMSRKGVKEARQNRTQQGQGRDPERDSEATRS
jgi:hypothetical protein